MMLVVIALATSLSASETSACGPFADSETCDIDDQAGGSMMLQRHETRNAGTLQEEPLNSKQANLVSAQVISGHEDASSSKVQATALATDKVIVTTVDTRGWPEHQLNGPNGWGNFTVHNVGAGKKWDGFKTKIDLMKEYISGLPDDMLVVFVDGGDMMYGGCDMNDLVERYRKVSNATGAPIIAGAETNCFEGPCVGDACGCGSTYPQHARNASLSLINLTTKDIDAWQQDEGQGYKFLNSGWLMGPVGKFKEFYDKTLEFGLWWTEECKRKGLRVETDQHWVQQMFQDHQDLVSVDYTTLLVHNIGSRLNGMKLEKDGEKLFEYSDKTGKWMSKLTRQPVCFFHIVGCCQEKDIAYDQLVLSGGFSSEGGVRPH
jgi:hypothetical protein